MTVAEPRAPDPAPSAAGEPVSEAPQIVQCPFLTSSDGAWRAVTFARAELEPELATDPMLGAVGWSWLVDALDSHHVGYTAEAGTVTRVVSESFAGLSDRPASVEMEVRASWTPVTGNVGAHLLAWSDLLCTIAGLPPLPEGVVALPGPRR